MQPIGQKRPYIPSLERLESKRQKTTNDNGKTLNIFSGVINGSRKLDNNSNVEECSKFKELETPHPEIIEIIKKGLQCAIKTTDWMASKSSAILRISRINHRARIIFQFDPSSGEILYLEKKSECREAMIPIDFEFFSKSEVHLDREYLKKCLRPLNSNDMAQERGISITALKILLTFEQLFSSAIDFSEQEISRGKIIYLGSLKKESLQPLIEDSTNQKIIECWTEIQQNAEKGNFLIGHLYAENPHDQKWDSQWNENKINENDILIVKKMKENRIERFAKASKIKPSTPYKGCVRVISEKDFKNLGRTHLKEHITRIW